VNAGSSGSNGKPQPSIVSGGANGTEKIRTVSVCDTQPVTTEGVRSLLNNCADLKLLNTTDSLNHAMELARADPPDVLILDKAFGVQAILDWMERPGEVVVENGENNLDSAVAAVVVWGVSVTESEALRFLQAGARGVLRKTAGLPAIIACVRTVAAGRSWMEDCVFRDSARSDRYPRSELTAREQQVLELVEQGCKNKEIAVELGIRPGTVKIHLKHIFEKTGIRGRYGLALNGWRDRGVAALPA